MAPKTLRVAVGASRFGFTLIEILVVLSIIALLVGLLMAAVQRSRQAASRVDCQNRLRQIVLASHQYHDAQHQLPPGYRKDGETRYLSWLSRLLPYLEQQALADRAAVDFARQPIFSAPPSGHPNLATPVAAFTCPAGDRATGHTLYLTIQPDPFPVAFTWYLGVSGTNSLAHDGLIFENSAVRFAEITDGLSNTLLLGERPPSPDDRLGWWYAGVGQWNVGGSGDSFLGVREYRDGVLLPMCDPAPSHFQSGKLTEMCDIVHFWSQHPGGGNFGFADGTVRFVRYSAADLMPGLATRAGGETETLLD